MSGGRLPKRIVFENIKGAVRRGRGEKYKERVDCVQSGVRNFDIAGGWIATVLEAEVWVETVSKKDGRRLYTSPRREKKGVLRQEKREASETRNVVTVKEIVELPKRHQVA